MTLHSQLLDIPGLGPWHISLAKGEPPTGKAWRKIAARVDMYLLCLFMVADRVGLLDAFKVPDAC